ncbi:hypothetical protein MIZ01_1739 [Sideroxyarcus emersonii]|uniref:Uncharacterized protein n=1 Tax=Sideroxyarcus emersonii TaxID=2764705 RepID=A0AAN1XAH9_9PROT|nr:hypothetical protein MIZ01_1739 [Sideroxyarcus emersonii]
MQERSMPEIVFPSELIYPRVFCTMAFLLKERTKISFCNIH